MQLAAERLRLVFGVCVGGKIGYTVKHVGEVQPGQHFKLMVSRSEVMVEVIKTFQMISKHL